MNTSSRIEPDIIFYEKSAMLGMRSAPASNKSSTSVNSAILSPEHRIAQPTNPEKSGVTPLPAWVDISLAVMTLGLSVPAFHAVRGVSEKRAAKKALKQQQAANTSDLNAYLIPSLVVRSATTANQATRGNNVMELDSSPLEPPPYSPGNHSQTSIEDTKARRIAELP